VERIKWKELDQQIANLMQQAMIPGLSLTIIKDQNIIYSKGYGSRQMEKNLKVDTDTLFGFASCVKIFTCLAIMQLAEQGKLLIDDPVNKYLPFKLGLEGKPILIRHLMSHSSGIPNLDTASIILMTNAPYNKSWKPFEDKDSFYSFINGAQDEVVSEPGERFFYLNSGFTLLGEIIEKVSGKRFEDYISDHILKPLDMNRSTFLENCFNNDHNKMTSYRIENDIVVPQIYPVNPFIFAAGGLFSSTNEFSNFLLMLLGNGQFRNRRIISPKSLQEMFSIQIETPLVFWEKSGYGFGVSITDDFLEHKLISHSGATIYSSAQFAFVPELNIGIVTAANTGNIPGILIVDTVLSMLLDKYPKEMIPHYKIQSKFELLSGEYKNYKGLRTLIVSEENGVLMVKMISGFGTTKHMLIPKDPKMETNEFFIYANSYLTPVNFIVNQDGNIEVFIDKNHFCKNH